MQLLFIFFVFIAVLIVIARLASKTRPDSERPPAAKKKAKSGKQAEVGPEEMKLLDALVTLLIRKKLISEEELQSAFEEVTGQVSEEAIPAPKAKRSGPI